MKATLSFLVLCLSFYCVVAKINLSYFRGSGCTPGSETKAACTVYATGTASLDIVNDDSASYSFAASDTKGVNGTVTISGTVTAIYVTKEIQDGLINHLTPSPAEEALRFSGASGQIERVNVRNNLNDTEFEYYNIAIVNYISPSAGSLLLPSFFVVGLFSVASFFF